MGVETANRSLFSGFGAAMSFFLLLSAGIQIALKQDTAHLNFDVVRRETAAFLEHVPPFGIAHNVTFAFSDGTKLSMPAVVGMRTYDGMPTAFSLQMAMPVAFWMHVLPTFAWAIIAPLQFTDRLRKAAPAVHRWCGRVMVLSASSIVISAVLFAYHGIGMAMLHVPNVPPLLEVYVAILAPWFAYTIYMLYTTAVARNIREHRKWVLRHVGVGYGIGLTRPVVMAFIGLLNLTRDYVPAFQLRGHAAYIFELYGFNVLTIVSTIITMVVAERRVAQEASQTKLKAR